jgi:predicted TIM-barrel fold metal-dependent hydrolase
MGDYFVVDCDGHVWETKSQLEPYGRIRGATPTIENILTRERREDLNSGSVKNGIGNGPFDISERLKDMDKEGIDIAINFPTALLGVSDFPNSADCVAAVQAYNSWYSATYRQADKRRFQFAAPLPMQDVEAAVQEAERAVKELGAVAFNLPPYSQNRHLDDPVYDPLYAKIQDLGVPICPHGSRHVWEPFGPRTWFRTQQRFYAMVHPVQQMAAMADLTLGGVFERFPRLKAAFMESGVGWMPYFIERLDEAFERGPQDGLPLKKKPSEYLLSGNCYFSCDPDEEILEFAAHELGEDQVIYASDYPHFDCTFPDSVRKISERRNLPHKLKAKILGENARKLFGL